MCIVCGLFSMAMKMDGGEGNESGLGAAGLAWVGLGSLSLIQLPRLGDLMGLIWGLEEGRRWILVVQG